jgi:hypothetical protein
MRMLTERLENSGRKTVGEGARAEAPPHLYPSLANGVRHAPVAAVDDDAMPPGIRAQERHERVADRPRKSVGADDLSRLVDEAEGSAIVGFR